MAWLLQLNLSPSNKWVYEQAPNLFTENKKNQSLRQY